ncbi:MAG: hypothetical protein ACKV0T_10590 [Planctomycetales bacterium]
MAHTVRWLFVTLLLTGFLPVQGSAADTSPPTMAGCATAVDGLFENDVWGRIGSKKCLVCHRKGGDAQSSQLVLLEPQANTAADRATALRHNRSAFVRMAQTMEQGESRLLLKVVGKLEHGGEEVLTADSPEYRLLADFVRRTNAPRPDQPTQIAAGADETSFFDGVQMLDDRRLLRRITLSLAGRLPRAAETEAVARDGLRAIPELLDPLLNEEAFYERLREGFNDIFLTLGIDGNADQTVLSYEHFEKTRHWTQHHDLSHIADKDTRQRAEWALAAEYRKTLLEEPLRLIDYVVRHDRPFTEIVTADYILVSPYSARGYGVFDEVREKFKNPEDPYEYVPVRLKALVGRSRPEDQESATGFYPHAGLLSTFQYLTRYPTTETNRNRLRARMYFQHFLGVDVLELAARVSDAAAVTAKYEIPTMQAAECVVCHRTLDPVAGLFQDYWRFADQGVYGKRKEGWFTDMFGAGFEGDSLPPEERWRSLQWLGERTAKDPRFAVAMTEHVYSILTGRRPQLPPRDFDDPLYPARLRAYAAQRRQTEEIAARFAASGFQLKEVFRNWVLSDFYRADGLTTVVSEPCRLAELEDLGLVRLLSPEQIERKIAAVFGARWGRLTDQYAILYGGIDSKEVTDRAADPSGAMGAIQRTMSNDVACRHVAADFARPAAERVLFPRVEPTLLPGASPETDAALRQGVVLLHERILGRNDPVDSPEIERSFQLFADIVREAQGQPGFDKRENYFCRHNRDAPATIPEDPHYTIRAWRSVVTYLLRQPEFLYE